jgi:TRAP-type C4-dicarboxylate transport system permease small subunit
MRQIDAAAGFLFRLGNSLSMILITFVMLIAVANVITRAIFNVPITGTLDMVRLATLSAVAFAMAYNESVDGNVAVTLVLDSISPRKANAISIFTNILSICFSVIIAYQLFLTGNTCQAKGDVSETLRIPLFIFHYILSFSFGLLCIALIIKLIHRFMNHKGLPKQRVSFEQLADESVDKMLM